LQYRAKVQNRPKLQKTSEEVVTVTEREDPRGLAERFIDGHLNRMDKFFLAGSKLSAASNCLSS